MARARPGISIEVAGSDKVQHDLRAMAGRMADISPVTRAQFHWLELREERLFSRGKYVRTGALRASLTQDTAAGAIRVTEPGGLKFGTSVWYAPFQVVHPGPVTPKGGLRRKGHTSAVLKRLRPAERRNLAEDVGNWILKGHRPLL